MRGHRGRRRSGGIGAGRGRPLVVAALVLGVTLVAASSVAVWRGQGVSEVGTDAAAELTAPPPTEAGDPPVPITDGRGGSERTVRPPVTLSIPALGLAAQVNQVGITPETGEFDVPPSVDQVGWYEYGPGLEAEAGSIVVAGHVDSADQGHGAFYALGELAPGDLVEAADEAGEVHQFEVVAREVYDKEEIPLARYFARDGELRLTLITCGGEFDPAAGRYQDNVVVTAVPAP
ncbi:class F sortase [Natronosporangium hydrolyticum]|uniref:Class F sortase n=1 Tax=Natronosporangium hydrolyticum TaxID=2811111 RepID=A0A895YHU7_9ACTN|nr:class F sortase [Natronosporangium hydrolyticum]QSB14126.1 class F sortase [Natronosporangium hydrolyticum]